MTEFHDWEDIRAELSDGDDDALQVERVRTEEWVSAFRLAGESLRDLSDDEERRRSERRAILDQMVADAEEDGLYEATAVPRRTR